MYKIGIASFVVFVLLLVSVGVLMVMGLMADPGGHPPAAAVVWMLAALIVMYVSPFGILLGFLGLIRAPRKYALIGLLGNIGLGTLALYMMTPWKVL